MFALAGRFGYFYPSANTIIEIEIGTIATDHNYAEITGDSTGIADGPSLFQEFWTGPHQNAPPTPRAKRQPRKHPLRLRRRRLQHTTTQIHM
jgi:hypothetical protein